MGLNFSALSFSVVFSVMPLTARSAVHSCWGGATPGLLLLRNTLRGGLIAATALVAGVPMASAGTFDKTNIVMRFCQLAVSNEALRSAQPVPEGLSEFTCQCFLRNLDLGSSLNAAKANCRQAAIRRYGL